MEVMVAVTIFTIVVTVGIGSLLIINNASRQAQIERQATDSLTYMLEAMSRRIRTASEWDRGNNYGDSSRSFSFVDQDGIGVTYSWVDEKIEMEIKNDGVPPEKQTTPTGIYDLTPQGVRITDSDADGVRIPGGLYFTATGVDQAGAGAGYLQINIGGIITQGSRTANFMFQTGVSKRVIDYPMRPI